MLADGATKDGESLVIGPDFLCIERGRAILNLTDGPLDSKTLRNKRRVDWCRKMRTFAEHVA